jgi:uncharacterized protein YkwD
MVRRRNRTDLPVTYRLVVSGSSAVDSWYNQISLYNFNAQVNSQSTAAFSQVVWRSTTQVGVGIALASDNRTAHVVIVYFPAGNLNGAFLSNVPAPCSSTTNGIVPPLNFNVPHLQVIAEFRQQVLAQHNVARQLHCVTPLSLDDRLNGLAQEHANFLAMNNLYQHSGKRGYGENLWSISSSHALPHVNGNMSVRAGPLGISRLLIQDRMPSSAGTTRSSFSTSVRLTSAGQRAISLRLSGAIPRTSALVSP